MEKKFDSKISLVALILAVLSIVNFQKVLIIIQLLIAIAILVYVFIKKTKENKVPQMVFSLVTIINSILWLLFVTGLYEKMVS